MKKATSTNRVLEQIFSPTLFGYETDFKESYISPTLTEIKSIARLLAKEAKEELLQKFLNNYPHFLFRSIPTSGDTNLGLLLKPSIGLSFKADYGIISAGCSLP